MRIAIVEDDRIDMSQLRSTLEAFCSESGIPCELDGFTAGKDFLAAFSAGKYEMFFLTTTSVKRWASPWRGM